MFLLDIPIGPTPEARAQALALILIVVLLGAGLLLLVVLGARWVRWRSSSSTGFKPSDPRTRHDGPAEDDWWKKPLVPEAEEPSVIAGEDETKLEDEDQGSAETE